MERPTPTTRWILPGLCLIAILVWLLAFPRSSALSWFNILVDRPYLVPISFACLLMARLGVQIAQQNPPARGGQETILIVEDDVMTRTAYSEILNVLNYQVLEAANGRQALTILEQHKDEIALVLSDWIMPQIGGITLYRELQRIKPGVKILVCTGYPHESELEKARAAGVIGWLSKPVNLSQLARAISQALAIHDD